MDFVKFVWLLETHQLWFSRLDLLDDPHEGRFTDAEYEQVSVRRDDLVRHTEAQRVYSYVSCWQEGEQESMAMWDLYGGKAGSIAIATSVSSLKDSISLSPNVILISRINYVDWTVSPTWHDNSVGNTIGISVRKPISYRHESEVRLLISNPRELSEIERGTAAVVDIERLTADICDEISSIRPDWNYTPPQLKHAVLRGSLLSNWRYRLSALPKGIAIHIGPLDSLVDKVIVGPREPQWFYDLVQNVLARYGCTIPIRQSEWTPKHGL